MNIRDLKYLVAVAECRHFGHAAEMCHVSQPTLSTQLKKLEETLDVVLIERTNRQVVLSAVGEKIVAQTERAAAEDLDIAEAATEFQSRQTSYDAALRAYSMIQDLSLFDYIR